MEELAAAYSPGEVGRTTAPSGYVWSHQPHPVPQQITVFHASGFAGDR